MILSLVSNAIMFRGFGTMPVLDGFAVLSKIRENPSFATLTVLATAAYAMQSDRENTLKAGFDGYLSKPINAHDLANEIQHLLRKREDHSVAPKRSPQGNVSGKMRPS